MNETTKAPDRTPAAIELAGSMTLTAWRKAVGISRTTAWFWRRSGKLKVVYRYGRAYVTAEENRRFLKDDGAMVKERSARKHKNSGLESAGSVDSNFAGARGGAARSRRQ